MAGDTPTTDRTPVKDASDPWQTQGLLQLWGHGDEPVHGASGSRQACRHTAGRHTGVARRGRGLSGSAESGPPTWTSITGRGRQRAGLSVQRRGCVAGAKWQRDWGTQQQTRPRIRSLILRQPGSHHRHCPRDCDPGRQGRGLSWDPAARAPQTQSPRLRASPEAPSAGPACPPGRCVTRPSSPRPPGRHCKPGRSA